MSSSSFLKSLGVRKIALAFILSCMVGGAAASPSGWREELPNAVLLGSGQMRWLGFRLYDAALWTASRPFNPSQPFALALTYHRDISRDRLVQTSMDEMRRIAAGSADSAVMARWEGELRAALVDVSEGDQLIGVYLPNTGMRLYDSRKLLAHIADPELARAFFGIWLDEASRDRKLRAQLLGLAK
jgi:hypothetical protein